MLTATFCMPLSDVGICGYVSIQVRLCMTEFARKRILMAENWTAQGQAPGVPGLTQAFVNTRYGSGRHYHEQLDTAERLHAWLTQHHLLDDRAPVTEGDLRRAISVREALRAVLRANTPATLASPGMTAERRNTSAQRGATHASLLGTARTPSTPMVPPHSPVADERMPADVLNAIAAYAPLSVRFQRDGQASLEPASDGVEGALARLLAAVPLAQVDGSWRRLKICRNDACGRAFFDASKNHSGAWCDLGKCGNRLNARASRARRRLGHQG
jgi:CGNR zinc finger/Putative stress-induced transcription regulator